MPGIVKRGMNYGRAMTRWAKAGYPTRTQDEIDALLKICHACDQFNHAEQACAKCGCNINRQQSGWKNKLSAATEACPLKKWGPSTETIP